MVFEGINSKYLEGNCYVSYFVSMLHTYFLVSFLLCVLPARFPVYRTILDLPAISILSCYAPLCHITDTFLFRTDFLMCMLHSISLLLMTPLHVTTYMSLPPASTSLILRILTCYLTVHLCVHSQSTYMFTLLMTCLFYLTCISSTLVKPKLLQTWSPL